MGAGPSRPVAEQSTGKDEKSEKLVIYLKAPWQIQVFIKINSARNTFLVISIRSCEILAKLPTLCISGKLGWTHVLGCFDLYLTIQTGRRPDRCTICLHNLSMRTD